VTVRVVIVEDERDVRDLVRLTLEAAGRFEVVGEAVDGRSALTSIAEHRPDLVILDLGLPDAMGIDLIPSIQDRSPATRVVVFSGWPEEVNAPAALARGAARYVMKGNVSRLLEALDALLDSSDVMEAEFAQAPTSIRAARAEAVRHLHSWGLGACEDDVSLIVSELATNAVVHAESSFTLRMKRSDRALRIEVTDCGSGSPNPRVPDQAARGGRGLHIITALTLAWGLDREDACKTVWCEVPLQAG